MNLSRALAMYENYRAAFTGNKEDLLSFGAWLMMTLEDITDKESEDLEISREACSVLLTELRQYTIDELNLEFIRDILNYVFAENKDEKNKSNDEYERD